jgi:putative sterol carrier protein
MADAATMTPKQIFEERIATRLASDPAKSKAINAVYQFDITGDNGGTWTVDLTQPAVVSGAGGKAQCTITMSSKDFVDIISEKLNPQMAFLQGRLKVAGDMSLALKLGTILKG